MKKIILLLGIALIGHLTLTGRQLDPFGTVITYDGKYLVLAKSWSKPDDKIFIPYRDESGNIDCWHRVDGRDSNDLVYVVKDTLLAISTTVNKIFTKDEIYELWASDGIIKNKRLAYGQKYDALFRSYVISENIRAYYNRNNRGITGICLSEATPRFPWENVLLFLGLFLIAIKVRNAFRNYNLVSFPLIIAIYLLLNLIFLEYLCISFNQVNEYILGILVIGLIGLLFSHNKWRLSMKYKNTKLKAWIGFITVSAGGIISGVILWTALGYWQFLVFSLIANQFGYFFPGLKGKYKPLKNFTLEPLEEEN